MAPTGRRHASGGSWGRRVRHARSQRGWSQSELAARAGVTQPTISLLESGRRGASDLVKRSVADALGVHWSHLFPLDELPSLAPVRAVGPRVPA